jgi:hypothetical protein
LHTESISYVASSLRRFHEYENALNGLGYLELTPHLPERVIQRKTRSRYKGQPLLSFCAFPSPEPLVIQPSKRQKKRKQTTHHQINIVTLKLKHCRPASAKTLFYHSHRYRSIDHYVHQRSASPSSEVASWGGVQSSGPHVSPAKEPVVAALQDIRPGLLRLLMNGLYWAQILGVTIDRKGWGFERGRMMGSEGQTIMALLEVGKVHASYLIS